MSKLTLRQHERQPESGGINLSLRDVVVTLYRRKWLIIAIALPIIATGGYAIFSQSRSYVAVVRVLVELANVDSPRWNVNSNYIDYDRELSTMFNIAMSASVAEQAAKSLEDSIPTIRGLHENLHEMRTVQDLTGFLMASTNVTVVGESRILEFQVSAVHPRLALMGVGAMQRSFMDYQIHGRKNNEAIAYYEDQIEIVRSQVDSLLAERAQILEDTGYSEMHEQLRVEAGSFLAAEHDLLEARSARRTQELEYASLVAALDRDPREFPMGANESRSSSLVHWRRIVTQHEDKLTEILSVHAPGSIPVRQQQEMLDTALQNLRREEVAYVESVRIALEGLKSREAMLGGLVDELEKRRRNAPRAYYKISMIDAESNSMRDVMESLQGKLGEVRLASLADERISSIVNLTRPELVPFFSGGKSIIYFAMLGIFALSLGIAVAFILELMDHRLSGPDEVQAHLGIPVFASIPRAK